MSIIIGADYFGGAIKSVCDKGNVPSLRMAHLLECDVGQLHRYEAGVDLIPRNVLKRVFRYAAKMDAAMETE